ncbi:MAG: SDR family oxidoreductase [Candidatus Manganitrophus sp. SA1]|nr:SDR family oxidoreductase [Candidatus Manganitrophus morganii]
MSGLLENQVALITGASRGIGYAVAEAYLREGAKVIICGRDEAQLKKAETDLAPLGEVMAVHCDVSDLDQVDAMVERVIAHFGRIDILINNAGISMTFGRVGDIDPKRWAYVIAVNLVGTFNCCHAVIPHMMKQGKGKIFNVKGYGADFPSPRVTAYGATKAAIVAFTRSLAREYKGTGITANIFSPGMVRTDLLMSGEATDEGRPHREKVGWFIDMLANPVEVPAALAVKMVSPENDKATGQVFQVMTKRKFIFRALTYGLKRLIGRSTSSS